MDSKYDEWNSLKKSISKRKQKPPYFKEREIWWLLIGYNIGHEIYGKGSNFVRPVLIIRKFNQYTFIGIPLSTKIKNNKFYVKISLRNKDISALISQMRVFSTKRMSNKQGVLNQQDYRKVINKTKDLIKLPPPNKEGVVAIAN
jgi:mRNA interferase MazF